MLQTHCPGLKHCILPIDHVETAAAEPIAAAATRGPWAAMVGSSSRNFGKIKLQMHTDIKLRSFPQNLMVPDLSIGPGGGLNQDLALES